MPTDEYDVKNSDGLRNDAADFNTDELSAQANLALIEVPARLAQLGLLPPSGVPVYLGPERLRRRRSRFRRLRVPAMIFGTMLLAAIATTVILVTR